MSDNAIEHPTATGEAEETASLNVTILGDFNIDRQRRLTIPPHIRREYLFPDDKRKRIVYVWTDSAYNGIYLSFQKRPGAYPTSVDDKGRFFLRREIADPLPTGTLRLFFKEEKDGLRPVLYYKTHITDFFNQHARSIEAQNSETFDSDPVAKLIFAFMDVLDDWTGTASELLQILTDLAETYSIDKSALPTQPNKLSVRLSKISLYLNSMGIIYIKNTRRGNRRSISLHRKK